MVSRQFFWQSSRTYKVALGSNHECVDAAVRQSTSSTFNHYATIPYHPIFRRCCLCELCLQHQLPQSFSQPPRSWGIDTQGQQTKRWLCSHRCRQFEFHPWGGFGGSISDFGHHLDQMCTYPGRRQRQLHRFGLCSLVQSGTHL